MTSRYEPATIPFSGEAMRCVFSERLRHNLAVAILHLACWTPRLGARVLSSSLDREFLIGNMRCATSLGHL